MAVDRNRGTGISPKCQMSNVLTPNTQHRSFPSPMTVQTTIRNPVRFSHRGLLTGNPASIRLRPGPPDSGIVFDDSLPALLRHAFVENHFESGQRPGNRNGG